MQNINVVVITGNLTRDPELRSVNGASVCNLGVAVNGSRKDPETGEWVDKVNFFNVTVWGTRGERCAEYLTKGRPVAIEGRLDWKKAEDGKRYISIIARSVQFLGSSNGTTNGEAPAESEEAVANGGEEEEAS